MAMARELKYKSRLKILENIKKEILTILEDEGAYYESDVLLDELDKELIIGHLVPVFLRLQKRLKKEMFDIEDFIKDLPIDLIKQLRFDAVMYER